MGTARYVYNQALNLVKNENHKPNFMALRNILVPEKNVPQETKWQLLTPKDVRAEAIRDLTKAYANNFAKRKNNSNHTFEMRYRSKKNEDQSISLCKSSLSLEKDSKDRIKIYPRFLGKGEASVKMREPLPSLALNGESRKLLFDARLSLERGKWYLCVPYELKESDNQTSLSVPAGGIASLDPGVRTFQTVYSPDGVVYKFGQGDISRIIRLGKHTDRLQSKLTKKNDENYPKTHRRRRRFVYKVKKALQRLKGKIKNLVKELHCKLAAFLCRNFKMILLPAFPTQAMSNRLKRKIGSRTVRSMLTWSHYTFRKRLEEKAKERKDCQLVLVDEAYTSKTCTRCGIVNDKLGGCKVFRCSSCGLSLDRDINGARNILLRALSDTTVPIA